MGTQSVSTNSSHKKKHKKTTIVTAALVAIACAVGIALSVTVIGVSDIRVPFSPPSETRLGKFRTAAVATDGIPCSDIGRDVLLDGGNAVDAAIASLFCIGVVHPQSAGIGGGFLMTIYDAKTGKAECLDGREVAPLAATENMFGGNASLSSKGPLSVAVPGELAGYWAAHQRYGQLPWSRLVLPAALLAENGLRVNRHLAQTLADLNASVLSEPSMWDFVNAETMSVLKENEVLKRPTFAKTLRTIAEQGADVLYNGFLGDQLVEDIRQRGGIITKEDLQTYQPKWVEPIRVEIGNFTLYSMPPPGSGALVAYVLNILENYLANVQSSESDYDVSRDPLTYHRIAEAFKHAFAQRTKFGDSCCNETFIDEIAQLVANLTSEEYAKETWKKIDDSTTYNDPTFYGAVVYQPEDHGTSHVSVLDGDGMAVSATSTVNLRLGAGFTSVQTGILLNDEMDDFSSPNITNAYGVPPSPANFIQPGKRPLSSMAPTILARTENNKVRMVLGAAGGTKITTSVIYTIIRNVWFGETIKEAIDSRRMHHQLFPMEFQHETGFPTNIVEEMRTKKHNTFEYNSPGAVVTGVTVEDDGFIYANSDWRKTGDVAGIEEVD